MSLLRYSYGPGVRVLLEVPYKLQRHHSKHCGITIKAGSWGWCINIAENSSYNTDTGLARNNHRPWKRV